MLPSLSGRLHGLSLILGLALLAPGALRAQSATSSNEPTLSCKGESTYDFATKELVFAKEARLVYGDLVLTADTIRYNQQTKTASAQGNLILTRGDRRLLAEDGTYNLETDTIHVRGVRFGRFPFYITGDTVDGTMEKLIVTNARVFFRENASFAPSLSADKITYEQGRIVSGEGMKFGFLSGHFLSLPSFTHDLHSELISAMSIHAGYRSSLGLSGEFGLQVPVAEGIKLGGDAGLYTKRGFMIGPAATYEMGSGETSARGLLRSGYIHDNGDRFNDILGRPIDKDRGFLEWRHQQNFSARTTLQAQLNYWSDSEILRDFKPKFFFPVQQPDSFLELAHTENNLVASAFVRVNPHDFFLAQERLPELTLDLLPSPTPVPGLYHRLHAGIAHLQEDFLGLFEQRSTRFDAYYGVEYPFALAPWFTFTPVAGGRVTHYDRATGGQGNYTRSLGEIGFDAALRASGVFEYKNETWEIDGLRHLIEPRISYRYAPKAASGRAYIPPIDRRVFTTYLPPLSISDQRNIDDLDRLDTLRFSLNNTLQTRDKKYGSRDLATLNFTADQRFSRQPGQRRFSDLYTEATVSPASWLRLEVFQRFATHDTRQEELNYAISITDQDEWAVRLSSHYLRGNIGYEEYLLDYRQRVSDKLHFIGRWRFDARRSRLNEQSYGFIQRFGQTWDVRYELSFNEGQRRESSFSFNVEIELLKF